MPITSDLDRQYFGERSGADQVGLLEGVRARFGKSYVGEPDQLAEELLSRETLLEKDLESPEVGAAIQENVTLGDKLGLTGTPDIGFEAKLGTVADTGAGIPPDALPRHLKVLEGMRTWLDLAFTLPPGLVTAASSSGADSFQLTRSQGLALSALFFLALAAVGLDVPRRLREGFHLRRARRSRRPAPRAPVHYLPEVDREPRVVDGPERLERELQRQRCGCGGVLSPLAGAEPARATGSGAQALTRVRMHCTRCGSLSTLSFDVRPH